MWIPLAYYTVLYAVNFMSRPPDPVKDAENGVQADDAYRGKKVKKCISTFLDERFQLLDSSKESKWNSLSIGASELKRNSSI